MKSVTPFVKSVLAGAALSLSVAGVAVADPGDHGRHDHDWHGHDHGQNDQGDQGDGHDRWDHKHDDHYRDHDRHDDHHDDHRYVRGEYLPRRYRRDNDYIHDYRDHHLRRPPRGYRWVRDRDDRNTYLLVGIATGVIAAVVAEQH